MQSDFVNTLITTFGIAPSVIPAQLHHPIADVAAITAGTLIVASIAARLIFHNGPTRR